MFRLVTLYAAGGALWFFWKKTWRNPNWQIWWFRIPFVGTASQATARYRWILSLHLQFSAGIALPEAAFRAWAATFFARQQTLAVSCRERLLAGDALSEIVTDCPELPEDWIGYLQAGEVSGRTEETLLNLCSVAEIEWRQAMKTVATWVPKIFYGIVVVAVAWQLLSGAISTFNQLNALDLGS
jgi:type II secretory pathway component PulF